jgi:hypothetical protein
MNRQELHRIINKIIDFFLEDKIKEFEIKLNAVFTEEEFQEIVGNYDSSNNAINNDIITDEYVYDYNEKTLKKLFIEYIKQPDNKYAVISIEGKNDFIN